jgi:hypothetical protein
MNFFVVQFVAAWKPFVQPIPGVWDYWPWLMVPLCAGVAIVWKSIKCHRMKRVPVEAMVIFLLMIGGLVASAVGLWVLEKVVVN